MDRNTLLAILFCIVALFSYQTLFPAPKQADLPKSSQTIAAQENSSVDNAKAGVVSEIESKSTNIDNKTADYTISSKFTNTSYSNVGGSLHNVDFIGNNYFPITDVLTLNAYENVKFSGEQLNDQTISFAYTDQNIQITKIFEHKDGKLINVRMEIKNLSKISILKNISIGALEIDESSLDINHSSNSISSGKSVISSNSRETALFEYSVYANNKIFRKGNAVKFNDKSYKSEMGNVNWVGFRDHYHALIVKPEFATKAYEIKADSDRQLNISIKPLDENLAPGETAVYNFSIYTGPQNPWIMKEYGKGFEKIVAFSNFAIIEWIGQAIYHVMPFFHKIFKSWGVAIILMSLLIYGITYPLTLQSMMSMRKMQEVQPKITALRERFKNDPDKLNKEMMEIYRREKINPLGGCLPFLIQMPFFMALYQILWRAQYFQGQGFLWIKDLTQPDRLLIIPFDLPFMGNEINILPILTGGLMFIQQRISSKNIVVTDEQQLMQQKMMVYILPVMMTCMFYKFASAWAIYFFVFYILSTLSQWRIAQLSVKK